MEMEIGVYYQHLVDGLKVGGLFTLLREVEPVRGERTWLAENISNKQQFEISESELKGYQ